MKAPARKRARIIDSDEEDENNVEMGGGKGEKVADGDVEKKTAQRLEKVCEEKQQAVNGNDVGTSVIRPVIGS